MREDFDLLNCQSLINMIKTKVAIPIVASLFVTLWLPSCNSNNNGGEEVFYNYGNGNTSAKFGGIEIRTNWIERWWKMDDGEWYNIDYSLEDCATNIMRIMESKYDKNKWNNLHKNQFLWNEPSEFKNENNDPFTEFQNRFIVFINDYYHYCDSVSCTDTTIINSLKKN